MIPLPRSARIGTKIVYWDVERDQRTVYPLSAGAFKHMSMRLWYPTTHQGKRANLLPPQIHGAVIKAGLSSSLPAWAASHLNLASSHAIEAPPSSTDLPVLILSHGLSGIPENYTSLGEQLAARGFIVAAMTHTDWTASCNIAPDGTQRPYFRYRRETSPNVDEFAFRNWQVK